MRTKIKILTFLSLLIFLSTSCEDFYQVNDKELIGRDLVVKNEEFITGLWDNLYHSFDNGFQEVGSTMLANACDEAESNVPFGATTSFNQGSWNSYNTPYNRAWGFLYQGINNASHFLEISDTTTNTEFNFYKEYKNYPDNKVKYNTFLVNLKAYRNDAQFFKAYFHFQLWKMYGKVPIVDRVITEQEAKALKQATTAEMVNYISGTLNAVISEFDLIAKMPNSPYSSAGKWTSNNLGRITKGAALALKCRLFLYAASPLYNDGAYNTAYCDSAAKAAAAIINSGIYSVDISYRKLQFNRTVANTENILDNRVDILDNNLMETWNYPKGGLPKYVNVNGVCSNATCPSQNLADAYNLPTYNASTPFANKDYRFSQTIYHDGEIVNGNPIESYRGGKDGIGEKNSTSTGYYLKKFVQDTITLPIGTNAPHVWYIFRYSEVLLNYAEAMFNAYGNTKKGYITGTDLNALEALNIVRLRAGKNTGNTALTGTLTNDLIRRERQMELAFEGHRFWDVRRWLIANTTENLPLRGVNITLSNGVKTYDTNYVVETRKFLAGMEHFPIPYSEMYLYPGWTQNWW